MTDIVMQPVKSRNVKSIGYGPTSKTLHVEFCNGGRYAYNDVSPEKHLALIAAKSIGSHLRDNIVGQHKHRKLET